MSSRTPFDYPDDYLKIWRVSDKNAAKIIQNEFFKDVKPASVSARFQKTTKTFWLLIQSPSPNIRLISLKFRPPIPYSQLSIRVWFYERNEKLVNDVINCKQTSIDGHLVSCYKAVHNNYEKSIKEIPIVGIEYVFDNISPLFDENKIENTLLKFMRGALLHIDSVKNGTVDYQVFNDFPDEISANDLIQNKHSFFEGAITEIKVNKYERSINARNAFINHYKAICSVCYFDFYKTYGDIGKNFIHVHHKVELAKINKEYQVDPINDLIPVCPNCHAMLHRTKPAMTTEQLKKILSLSS
jgi:hypothetical protein